MIPARITVNDYLDIEELLQKLSDFSNDLNDSKLLLNRVEGNNRLANLSLV